MDEIKVLNEAFGPDEAPSLAAEAKARTALLRRMSSKEQRVTRIDGRRRSRFVTTAGIALAAAAAVAAVAVVTVTLGDGGGDDRPPVRDAAPLVTGPAKDVLPYARPVSAAEYLENAAWTAERKPWKDPRPDQLMYIETLELRNKPAYEQEHPNDAVQPGQSENRKVQQWWSVDGQTMASVKGGQLVVMRRGEGGAHWDRVAWPTITAMTGADKVQDGVPGPGSMSVELDAFIGQYVVPPNVQAAIFRYLSQKPEMTINPDAVNIDGRPAVGLGRVVEGYRAQELLFDKETYQFIGEREVAIKDHVSRGDDGSHVTRKGDVFRQVIYTKMIIVDRPGDTQ